MNIAHFQRMLEKQTDPCFLATLREIHLDRARALETYARRPNLQKRRPIEEGAQRHTFCARLIEGHLDAIDPRYMRAVISTVISV
jgi:hypothetical protein